MHSRVFLLAIVLVSALPACSTASRTDRDTTRGGTAAAPVEGGATLVPPPPGGITLEPVEGPADTVEFHIGSPLLLRLRLDGADGCGNGTGQLFYFDDASMQLGWGFEEVSDSLVLRPSSSYCERFVLLSSEASNRLAEGTYAMRTTLFLDPRRRMPSNTIVVRAVRSTTGADQESYARFLQEQILLRPDQLRDPETLDALFGEGVPVSAESDVYRAVILFRAGDYAGAEVSLSSAADMALERRTPLSLAAAATRDALRLLLRRTSPGQ
jgi:hypothetical protein